MHKGLNLSKYYMRQKQIKGLDLKELVDLCATKEFPVFRAKQIYRWMYRHHITDISQMNNIPESMRTYLKENYTLTTLNIENIQDSKQEDTKKILFKTLDGKLIESVSMIDDNLHTVCISSQVGCNVDCKFCATGIMGFKRNLTSGEIIDQVIEITKLRDEPITNIVYMGMGEPFLNYEPVMKSADILHDHNGMNLGKNRITISTSGILPKIKQFIKEGRGYKLAISLNAPNNLVRDAIMPINKKWPIEDLISINQAYSTQNKRKKITFEYVIMDGINSSPDDAMELSKILKSAKCKINIIPYNETGGQYKRPSIDTINTFVDILSSQNNDNFQIMVRWSNGLDIDAGCGQLAISNNIKENKI